MTYSQIRQALASIFSAVAKMVASPRREELELALLGVYDKRWPRRDRPVRRILPPAFAAIVVAALVGLPMKVPAEYLVEVGKRITFALPAAEMDPGAFEDLFPDRGRELQITSQIRKLGDGAVVEVEVWGDALPTDLQLESRVRERFPLLENIEIKVASLQGRVRNNLVHKLAWDLFHAGTSPQEIAVARERLIQKLRQVEGNDADVQVDTDTQGSDNRIKIKVRKQIP